MQIGGLLARTLVYHWRQNLAVLAGVAVGTAVLTGALVVGDSVRGSLRDLMLERLGRVDDALLSDRFFRAPLADEVTARARGWPPLGRSLAAPAVVLTGSAASADAAHRAGRVNVYGVDERFWKLGNREMTLSLAGFEVVVNQRLADELRVDVGSEVLLRFERESAAPRESLLGRRSETVRTLRLTVKTVISDRGLGGFTLRPTQQLALNAYVAIDALQRALHQPGRANAIFFAGNQVVEAPPAEKAEALSLVLRRGVQLEDYGLRVRTDQQRGYVALESDRILLEPAVEDAALGAAAEIGSPAAGCLTYLANTLSVNGREIPYSTIAAAELAAGPTRGVLKLVDGTPAPALKAGEILLNQWAADELGAKLGSQLGVKYFVVGPRAALKEEAADFTLAGVVAMDAAATDRGWTPEYPGITDKTRIGDWDPPFPVDLKRIRKRDEEYWDRYRTAPKAFVALDAAQRLWSSRYGRLTSLRLSAAPGSDLAGTAQRFREQLLAQLAPDKMGLRFQAVKAEGLAAAEGGTDFGMLFVSFSFFLVTSAALLVGLLFGLGVHQRAPEIGLLTATGFRRRVVLGLLLAEGGMVAVAAGVAGLAGAVAYAWLMLAGLRTWWVDAVGTSALTLHVTAASLAIGYTAGLAVAVAAIWWAARRVGRAETRELLAGSLASGGAVAGRDRGSRIALTIAGVSAGAALSLLATALLGSWLPRSGAFFAVGAALLVAGLALLTASLSGAPRQMIRGGGPAALVRLAARNGARHRGRSVLVAALVASATFVIVAVGANRHSPTAELPRQDSGTGGFALVAESALPVYKDLSDPTEREDLGFSAEANETLAEVAVVPCRLRDGDDASCLNLYQPRQPRVLGVPDELISRGGFRFQASLARTSEDRANPWLLLSRHEADGSVPAVGDYNTLVWMLHKKLGDELAIDGGRGTKVRLRIVGLVEGSIFQSELLIAERRFVEEFPSESGYRYFLVQAPEPRASAVKETLERELADYGLDATGTAQRLESYRAVENTYLSTFQSLGALGLALGTLGLATVLVRNVVERRGELALLRALGFRRGALGFLVLAENAVLLVVGLLMGSVSALVAVTPHLIEVGWRVPWLSLAWTLAAVLAVGLAAGGVAVRVALHTPLLPALRAE